MEKLIAFAILYVINFKTNRMKDEIIKQLINLCVLWSAVLIGLIISFIVL